MKSLQTRIGYFWLILAIIGNLQLFPFTAHESGGSHAPVHPASPFQAGVVLLGRTPEGALPEQALIRAGADWMEPIGEQGIYRVHLKPGTAVETAMRMLTGQPGVSYVEPDYTARAISAAPNDPRFGEQWGLAKVQAQAAWDNLTSGAPVTVAVIDSGVDETHEDLVGQLWVNPGEIAGNGMDDDGNGYVDDIHGVNIYDHNTDLTDTTGHGTQVAGIIAAKANNGLGIAGMCDTCRLMIVKVMKSGGTASYSDIAAGVLYAAQKGAQVINLSLGGYMDSSTLRAAVETASQTALVVAGAGNDSRSDLFYPAAYSQMVLSVAGSDVGDLKTAASNYGTWVKVSAPGENIVTTLSGGGYASSSGTSLSAPLVSGLAGLLFSQHPDWNPGLVGNQIRHTTDSLDAINPTYVGQLGSGRVNALVAVTQAPQALLSVSAFQVGGSAGAMLKVGTDNSLTVSLFNDWADAPALTATLSTTSPDVTITKATAALSAIPAGKTVTNTADPFQISVPAGKYGLSIPFNLHLAAGAAAFDLPFSVSTESVVKPVSGYIASDTVWTSDQVYLADNIIVKTGVTLTIQPGTVIKVNKGKVIKIQGALVAQGTFDRPIVFTSAAETPAPGDWGITSAVSGGIIFDPASTPAVFDENGVYQSGSVLRYAVVEYGTGVNLNSGAHPYIDHNLIHDNYYYGLDVEMGPAEWPQAVVTANTITRTRGGAALVAMAGKVMYNLISSSGPVTGMSAPPVVLKETVDFQHNTITGNTAGNCGVDSMGTPFFSVICANGTALHDNNIVDNIVGDGQYLMANNSSGMVDAASNYWGTTDAAAVRAQLFDIGQDINKGEIKIDPLLTEPSQVAPAYLSRVDMDPADAIAGIGPMRFTLTFSRPMDQSADPLVGFHAVKNGTHEVISAVTDDVSVLAVDRQGQVWAGCSNFLSAMANCSSLWRYRGGAWSATPVGANGPAEKNVHSIYAARSGAVWFGHSDGHLSRWLNDAWTVYHPASTQITTITEDSAGRIYAAAGYDGGLYRLDGSVWTHITTTDGLGDNEITYLAGDLSGRVWAAGAFSLSMYDGAKWTVYKAGSGPLPAGHPVVWKMFGDSKGQMWISINDMNDTTYAKQLVRVAANNTYIYYGAADFKTNLIFNALSEDAHGNLYAGAGGGIYRFDGIKWSPLWVDPIASVGKSMGVDLSGSIWYEANNKVHVYWSGADYRDFTDRAWLSDRQWTAAFDVTSLIPRGKYVLGISGARGGDGLLTPDGSFNFSVDYAGQITDLLPPNPPNGQAHSFVSDASAFEATWSPASGMTIDHYRYAVGSTPGGSDVISWTTVPASTTQIARSGLGLTLGKVYWVSVQARNAGGLWSKQVLLPFASGEKWPYVTFLPLARK